MPGWRSGSAPALSLTCCYNWAKAFIFLWSPFFLESGGDDNSSWSDYEDEIELENRAWNIIGNL